SVRTWRARPELARVKTPVAVGTPELSVGAAIRSAPYQARVDKAVSFVEFDEQAAKDPLAVLTAWVADRHPVQIADSPGFMDVSVHTEHRLVFGDGVAGGSAANRDHVGTAGRDDRAQVL